MMAVRSGHATAVSSTNGSAWAMADAYAPLATVAGVAISPTRPLVVAATAWTAPGLDDAEHVDAERRLRHPLAQRRQRGRRRRVARHHEQLRAARQQLLGALQREALELGLRPGAVGQPGRVGQVQEVLVGQLHEQLVQDGQPAHAGVEDGDRARARIGGA